MILLWIPKFFITNPWFTLTSLAWAVIVCLILLRSNLLQAARIYIDKYIEIHSMLGRCRVDFCVFLSFHFCEQFCFFIAMNTITIDILLQGHRNRGRVVSVLDFGLCNIFWLDRFFTNFQNATKSIISVVWIFIRLY